MSMNSPWLRITEIFLSIQGEADCVGYPTVFVRLTGCPLRCAYCDSAYAFEGGERKTLASIVDTVLDYGVQHVCVTGGEPLAQPEVHALLTSLCDQNLQVSLETSGAMSVADVDVRVSRVIDFKTPLSKEQARNDYNNVALLTKKAHVKFVICDRTDYEWSLFKVNEYQLHERAGHVFFSPAYEQLPPRQLAEWIIQDRAPVRLQIQLHKVLWGDRPGV